MNFGFVEADLYRSGEPNELNFPFLEKLRIKTIIYLAPDDPPTAILNFVDDHDMNLHNLGEMEPGNLGGGTVAPISEEVVLAALEILLQNENYPVLVMCNLGRHRTGMVIGCLRKLQGWSLTAIFEEYRRYAGSKIRLLNEQFIEFFDTDLISVPAHPPEWLYSPGHHLEHHQTDQQQSRRVENSANHSMQSVARAAGQ
eukprot:Clim_evm50s172 gene=Clim_evmTU50s172